MYSGPSKHSTRYEVKWDAVAVQSHKGIRRTFWCIPSQLWGRIWSRVRLAEKEPHQKSTVLGRDRRGENWTKAGRRRRAGLHLWTQGPHCRTEQGPTVKAAKVFMLDEKQVSMM